MHPLNTIEPQKPEPTPAGCALTCGCLIVGMFIAISIPAIVAAFWWGVVGKMFEN